MEINTNRRTDRKKERHTGKQTERYDDNKKRQAGRHTDKQTGRQEKERNRQKVKSVKQFLRGIIYYHR